MKRKATIRRRTAARKPAKRPRTRAATGQIFTGNLALHDLFQQQAAAILDEADIGEEEKQSILLAMSCPCCGAGGMSFSVKMKPKAAKRFVADET
ncbi:MAG: hypothetical protein QOG74_720 [Alphaproteobacteria bacterium]|jgi:hypothetical protein|nr:hypothetical protein [Alphaproteobacteria bacterium]